LGWMPGDTSLRLGTVTEYTPARVSIFDMDGNALLRWSDPDPDRPGYVVAPHGLWVDDEGSLYLAEVTHTFAARRGLGGPDTPTFQKFARV
jgi:hypothetical protein